MRFPLEDLHSKKEQSRMDVPLSSLRPACTPSGVRCVYFAFPALPQELEVIIVVRLTLAVRQELF